MKAAIEKLIDALKQIEQYSDPGDPMTAVIEMKSIASDALKFAEEIQQKENRHKQYMSEVLNSGDGVYRP